MTSFMSGLRAGSVKGWGKGMKNFSLLRAILSAVVGLAVGVIIAGLVNLVMPATNLLWTLIPMCLAAAVSGFFGYLVGARQKK